MTNAQMPEDRGWYPDPFQAGELLRLFDGARWTEKTRPIPDDYDAKKANVDSKTSAPEKKEKKQSAPAQPTPPQFSAPAESKSKPEKKAPAKTPAAHPKNGTAPMFQAPTAKAAREDEVQGSGPKTEPKKDAPAPPAFSTPTAKAMRDDEADTEPADPQPPTLEPKKKFQFSKPAPGTAAPQGSSAAGQPAPKQPTKPAFAPPAGTPSPTPAGPPAPTSVDDDFTENSDTVNAAFASAAPDAAGFADEGTAKSTSTGKKPRSKGPANPLKSIPLPDFMSDSGTQLGVAKWIVAVLIGALAIAAPTLGPEATKSVAADCLPISKVVSAYDGEEDYTVDSDAQADLAAAVSTGQLNKEVTDLVTTAVETNNLESVVNHCLPQE